MKIVLATFGSLGDLHPFIAIGRALAAHGHRPVVASFPEYRHAVESAGVGFAPLRPDMTRFGDRARMMKRLVHPWQGPRLMVRGIFMPYLRETYEDLARACRDANLLVTHPLIWAGPLLAERTGLRWASCTLSPMTMFSSEDPPVLPAAPWLHGVRRLGAAPYRLLFRLPRAVARRWEAPLRAFRAELGLPPTDALAQFEGQFSPRLHLALFPAALAAPQPDWPASTVVCGFARYDGAAPDERTRGELEAFLAEGEPPLVFGLGSSAVLVAEDFWRAAIDAAARLGRRAILLTGTPPQGLGALPPTVKRFDYLPYSSVFPHAAVIVHPGGIGTLAQALCAGRPQLIVPVAFDQPDNARRTVALGVARSLPFARASAQALAHALDDVMTRPGYARRAAELGAALTRDDGAAAAAAALVRAAG